MAKDDEESTAHVWGPRRPERRKDWGRRATDASPLEFASQKEFARFRVGVTRGLEDLKTTLAQVITRLDRMDLNGSTKDLKEIARSAVPLREIAEHASPLLRLAEAAAVLLQPEFMVLAQSLAQSKRGEILIEMLDEATQRQLAAAYLKKLLRPYKPVGALLWAFLLALVGAVAWTLVRLVKFPT